LCAQLSWSHIKALTYIDEPTKRESYAKIAALEHWSVSQMNERIKSMLFERTAISKTPDQTIQTDLASLEE